MAAPGWYPDATAPGTMRWWDGTQWTAHTMDAAPTTGPSPAHVHGTHIEGQVPAVPPAPQPKLRADGSVRGPTFRTSMAVLLAGVALMVVSALVVVPAFLDSINGPRLSVPGSHTLDLDEGPWVLYERTGRTRGGGGVTFDTNRGVSIGPGNISVDGPGPVDVRSDLTGLTETITRGQTTYTGAVRLEVETAGEHRITVEGAAGGEVLVARPITDLFSRWPWFVAFLLGGVGAVTGLVMWIVGASNRRTARRAGYPEV